MALEKKQSVVGLAVFIAMFAGINGWFLYHRSTAPKLQLSSSNRGNSEFRIEDAKIAPADIKKIINANGFNLLLLHDGRLFGGGMHTKGQLGVGSQEVIAGRLYQVQFPDSARIADISAADSHSIALDTSGNVWTWGMNISGQIGNNSHNNQNVPVKVLDDAAAVTAGYRFSAAAKKDGSLWAWGMSCDRNNPELEIILQQFAANATAGGSYYGGAEVGDTQDCINEQHLPIASITPRQVADVTDVKQLSGGYGHLVWLNSQGELWSWGCNAYGQLGREKSLNTDLSRVPAPVTTVSDIRFESVSAGFRHSLALDTNGNLWAWGHNASAETASEQSDREDVPMQFKTPERPKLISAGYDATAILTANGTLYAIGDNSVARLTTDPTSTVTSFIKISDRINTFTLGRDSVVFTRTGE